LSAQLRFENPKKGEVLYIGNGPYQIRWDFKGFHSPTSVKLDIFLGESCRIASALYLTHKSFFWIPKRNLCGGLNEGMYFLKAVWKGGEARSPLFYLRKIPLPSISLRPDSPLYRVGERLTVSWPALGKGKGKLSLWEGGRLLCTLGQVPLSSGSITWEVPARCEGKGLLGRFLTLSIISGEKEVARSEVFKITGEMPPVRRRFR